MSAREKEERFGEVQLHLSEALEILQHMHPGDLTPQQAVVIHPYFVQITDEVARLLRGHKGGQS